MHAADPPCTITNPATAVYGNPYTVTVSGPDYGNVTVELQIQNGTKVAGNSTARKLPITLNLTANELPPNKYKFQASIVPGNYFCFGTTEIIISPDPNAPITNVPVSTASTPTGPTTSTPTSPPPAPTSTSCVGGRKAAKADECQDPRCKPSAGGGCTLSSSTTSATLQTRPITPAPPCDKADLDLNGNCKSIVTGVGRIPTDPAGFIKWFFGFLLGIGGGIALLLIIYSGYKFMTSRGDPERTKGAKETFTSALIGLIFLIFSMVILQVIAGTILNVPGLK